MTKVEVMRWMIDTQLGRRNLSPNQRIVIAKKYEGKFREMAQENKVLAGKIYGCGENSSTPIGVNLNNIVTEVELSKMANVGKGTMSRFNVVANSDNEELKQKMFNDEITINAAYGTSQDIYLSFTISYCIP